MTHFFLSPHPDDAALSCGGQIATLVQQGERVLIITVMAGDPPQAEGFTPGAFVRELWARWGLGEGRAVTSARRGEDRAAAAILGAEIGFWPLPEAIYRISSDGQLLYPDAQAIFGDVNAADPIAQAVTEGRIIHEFAWQISEDGVLHIPLSVGGHVDHRLTRRIAQTLFGGWSAERVAYYEEYPYSLQGASAIEQALTRAIDWLALSTPHIPVPVVTPVDLAALQTKINAVNAYRSQISSFWQDADEMAQSIYTYTHEVGGEREWRIIAQHESEESHG